MMMMMMFTLTNYKRGVFENFSLVYVFYVGHVGKRSLCETLFQCKVLSKHHYHHDINKTVIKSLENCIYIYIYVYINFHDKKNLDRIFTYIWYIRFIFTYMYIWIHIHCNLLVIYFFILLIFFCNYTFLAGLYGNVWCRFFHIFFSNSSLHFSHL
jgi:hypothetical protein